MADTMPCPGCQATLRVPTGAAAIRCPACKTVITLDTKPVTAPVIPLPFDAPKPPPPPPVARAVPVAKAAPTRAAVVHDDDPPLDEDDEGAKRDAKGKRRNTLLDFDDDELSEKELKEKRRIEELYEQAKPARTGTQLLSYTCLVDAIAHLLGFLYLLVATFSLPIVPIAWAAIGMHIIALFLEIAGLSFCIKGPKPMRSMAVWGLCVSVMALLTLGIAFFYSLAGHAAVFAGAELFGSNAGMTIWVIAPLAPTLEFMNLLYWVSDGNLKGASWFMVFPGLLELARHSYTAVLMRSYCEEGKAPELGWKVSRFMFRLYLAYGSFFVTRVIACALVVLNVCQKDDSGLLIYLGLSFAGGIISLCVAMVAQFYALKDAADVVDYKRFAMKIRRLEAD
jgi:LSD1 subclass zinc finger protein